MSEKWRVSRLFPVSIIACGLIPGPVPAESPESPPIPADLETCDALMERFFSQAGHTTDESAKSIRRGRWRIIEISGQIRDFRPDPGIPEVCPPFEATRQFIADDPESFLELTDTGGKSLFTASFGLGAGNYMGNRGLEAQEELASDASPEGEQARQLLKGIMELLPKMMETPIYRGKFDGRHAVACFAAETNYSDTASGRDYGSGEGGFLVWGRFDGPQRIAGEWQFFEHGHAPAAEECCTFGYGRGNWEARAP